MKKLPKANSEMPAAISTQTVETLVGLSERRLRQLAESNKFSQPKNGQWATVETIRGVVAHYRKQATADELDSAKIQKLQTENRLLLLTESEKTRELVEVNEIVGLMQRGLQAMTQSVLAMTDLEPHQRDAVILKLRETGESVVEKYPTAKG